MFLRDQSRHLSSAMSQASTAVDSADEKSLAHLARQDSTQHMSPRREYSLMRDIDRKNVLRLVDSPSLSPSPLTGLGSLLAFQDASHVSEETPHPLSRFLVDFVQVGHVTQYEPMPDDFPIETPESPNPAALQPKEGQWWSLEVATDQFIPSVVPAWKPTDSVEKEQKPRQKFTSTVKAFIKRSKKGFVIRLLHRTKDGFDDIAEIQLADMEDVAVQGADLHEVDGSAMAEIHEVDGSAMTQKYELDNTATLTELPDVRASSGSGPIYVRSRSNNSTITLPISEPPQYSYASPIPLRSKNFVLLNERGAVDNVSQVDTSLRSPEIATSKTVGKESRLTRKQPGNHDTGESYGASLVSQALSEVAPHSTTSTPAASISSSQSASQRSERSDLSRDESSMVQGPLVEQFEHALLRREYSFAESERSSLLGRYEFSNEEGDLASRHTEHRPGLSETYAISTATSVVDESNSGSATDRVCMPEDISIESSLSFWDPALPFNKMLENRIAEGETFGVAPRDTLGSMSVKEPSSELRRLAHTLPRRKISSSVEEPTTFVGRPNLTSSSIHAIPTTSQRKPPDDRQQPPPQTASHVELHAEKPVHNTRRLLEDRPLHIGTNSLTTDMFIEREPHVDGEVSGENRTPSGVEQSEERQMTKDMATSVESMLNMASSTNSAIPLDILLKHGLMQKRRLDDKPSANTAVEELDLERHASLADSGTGYGHKRQGPRNQLALFATVAAGSLLRTFVNSIYHILSTQQETSPVRAGHVRIRWNCSCGKELFDDFIEQRPGAGRLLEQHLNRPRTRGGASTGGSSSGSKTNTSSQSSLRTQDTVATSIDSSDIALSKVPSDFQRLDPRLSMRSNSNIINIESLQTPLWLLTCTEQQRFTVKLVHLDATPRKINSDMDLALLVINQYAITRSKWRQMVRLRGLTTIRFVQFELHRSQVVDIRKCPDVPDKSDDKYQFAQSDLIPPVGENYLMHLLQHPTDYSDEIITYKRIPKKRDLQLRVGQHEDVTIGWGIHLVEGFLAYKVWGLFTNVFVLVSLVFAITWAVKKGDVQGAFGVASWVCTLAVLIIGCVVAYLE